MVTVIERAGRPLSLILLLAAAVLCVGWADTWEGIREGTGTIRTIRADFVQEKHLGILAKPFVSKGVFYYQAPDSLRWEYTSPVRSILLMHKGKTKRYTETGDGLVETVPMDLQGMQIMLQQIASWLGGRFSEDPSFDAVLKPNRTIVLTPKEKGISRIIQHIDLGLSDTPGIIRSVEIYEGEDSVTRIEFENALINQEIEESLFLEIS
jgi:outer membrane lipoprotein-sorting protein